MSYLKGDCMDSNTRDTFAYVDTYNYRIQASATLLDVSANTLRSYIDQSEIHIERQSSENPKSPSIRVFNIQNLFDIASWRKEQELTKKLKAPIFVAVYVMKGGTGKSTTAAELATQLQLSGQKVLAIDLDIQANLTHLLGYEADFDESDASSNGLSQEAIIKENFSSLCRPFLEKGQKKHVEYPDINTVIKKPFGENGVHLIPSDIFLGDLERVIISSSGPRELTFRKFFEASQNGEVPGFNVNDYDVIIFDCPPASSFTSLNAMAASDFVIAPVRMEEFSVKGLNKLIVEVGVLKEHYQLEPDLVILPTYYVSSLTRVSRMAQKLMPYQGLLAPEINASEEFPKSLAAYLPLTLQKPGSDPVKQYRRFTNYMLKKFQEKAK